MSMIGPDTLQTKRTLNVDGIKYRYFALDAAAEKLGDVSRLPRTLKVLLENVLRFEDGHSTTPEHAKALVAWAVTAHSESDVPFHPARILMQDFTGVPALVDLAAMREGIVKLGGNAYQVSPRVPVDLVIDHSVVVDVFGTQSALEQNMAIEFERNRERYEFLRWGQEAFANFRVVPPGTGICHQVNLEYLAQAVWVSREDGELYAYPDTVLGTDSHTTMINGMGVLGWGVGGIEAEAAMLGQSLTMLIPDVIGVKLTGRLREGVTATDLVLTITQILRAKSVVGKFVEFYGSGLDQLRLADRATIANMAPEYGATCGFFPVDEVTLRYLRLTGRDDHRIALIEAYSKTQGLWGHDVDPIFSDSVELDLSKVEPSVAGPKRPQDRVSLGRAHKAFEAELEKQSGISRLNAELRPIVEKKGYRIGHGDIVIAAITSCTNTSNPSVMVAAGLVARKARALGLLPKPWTKTSLAPGSQVVTEYLTKSGLQEDLDALGFQTVGYGCTTCIGNSGPLDTVLVEAIETNRLISVSILSGNRNFEGRVHPNVRANYLASPPLVVAYALLGTICKDITVEAIGTARDDQPVYLKDIWPTTQEITEIVEATLTPDMFRDRYNDVFKGPKQWQAINVKGSLKTYTWNDVSTYVQHPPYFDGMTRDPAPVTNVLRARILAMFGDSITTDHISPAGSFSKATPAGKYLQERQILPKDFNSYGSRRGNHEIMMRGTFANIRIRNEMLDNVEGGYTRHYPSGDQMTIFDAAMRYKHEGVPLVVVAGREYGTGSSRDWAAKGTILLGVKAVLAESFERIHRSNLVGMGVLPLVFKNGMSRTSLGLKGDEILDIRGIEKLEPRMDIEVLVRRSDGSTASIPVLCRIDTKEEVAYYRNGGILHYVLRQMANSA